MWVNFDKLSPRQYQKFKTLTDRAWRNKIEDLTFIYHSFSLVEKTVKFDEEFKKRTPASDTLAGKAIYDKYSNIINHLDCKEMIKNHNDQFNDNVTAQLPYDVEELKKRFNDGRLTRFYGNIIWEIFAKSKK